MIGPLGLSKYSNVDQIIVGNIATYTIKIQNTTGVIINDVTVKDLLSPDIDFIEDSVEIDGFKLLGESILKGVNIGTVGVGATKYLTFKARIVSKAGETVNNQATVTFTYVDPEDGLTKIDTKETNINSILVESAELYVDKMADKEEVQKGDTIVYKIEVENKGTVEAVNIVLKDIMSDSVQFVEDSLKVNGVVVQDADLELGLNIGSLEPGGKTTVVYEVIVESGSCSGYIENCAYAIFNYVLPNRVTGTKESNRDCYKVKAAISAFKQLVLDKYCQVPCEKPDIEEVNDVVVDIVIDDSYVINTVKSVSNEGQQLSGNKLVIHGCINISIEYTADVVDQAIHSTHCYMPFSTFIMLPSDYVKNTNIEVSSILENVDVDMVDPRGATVNMAFLVVATVS